MASTVLFMSDEHNPFYSSAYGHSIVQTPNMERLAASGTLFENAYCPSPLCLPSRSAFMAGSPVHRIQTYSNCNVRLDPTPPSYGRILRDRGVTTVYIGKTDVYAPAARLGFTRMIRPGDRKWPGDVNHRRRPLQIRANAAARADGFGPRSNAFRADAMSVDAAVAWLKTHARPDTQPFLLVVNTGAPHFPHYVTPDLWEMYAGAEDLPKYGPEAAPARHPYAHDLRRHFQTEGFSESQVRGLRRGYYGCVTWVDRQLGRILDVLEDLNLRNSVNVVYTSDHGEMLGKFGMWWKCSMYEDSVRIPLIAAGPDFAAGKRVRTPVSLLDLHATLFALFGLAPPPDSMGCPVQKIAEADADRAVFAEYHGHGVRSGAFMVRRMRWKLIFNTAAPHQLFDLETDPDELVNVYDRHPEVAASLEQELRRICRPEYEAERAHAFEDMQFEVIDAWRRAGLVSV